MVRYISNVNRRGVKFALLSICAVAVIFSLVFHVSATPARAAEEVSPVTLGKGPVQVRLYSDYSCSNCDSLRQKVEPILTKLVKQDVITVSFIDTSFFRLSALYAGYFLFAAKNETDMERIFLIKAALYEASNMKKEKGEEIEEFLKSKDIEYSVFDTGPVFALYGKLKREDGVDRVPTCIIEKDGVKEKYTGGWSITRALSKLKAADAEK